MSNETRIKRRPRDKKRPKKESTKEAFLDVTNGKPYAEHIAGMDDMPKVIDEEKTGEGLFNVPLKIKGQTDYGRRLFLVFYFDDRDEYDLIVDKLLDRGAKYNERAPLMDTRQLVRLLNKKEGE